MGGYTRSLTRMRLEVGLERYGVNKRLPFYIFPSNDTQVLNM